ncbi:putative chromatin assembly factor 1 subunit b protein [Eutypa lata UCREL1]|uniref:Putative chromatin assembly factor 1 subunit b protein n=1 Tax=Eutypa lata (strain UCR-EL1) TaxID=1287681 RepID=M7STQ3_EUTLA|nr:putative chromatin assembly factor 1 subunit b protein [Eutypa lata UCREL1]
MKATPLILHWHDQDAPIYSAHFEPHGKGRLATGGGDNNVRIWKVEGEGEDRKVDYLSTLTKHTQAVNVVRWAPKGETLASAGDDGNVILWVPSETHHPTFGNEGLEDKETWRTKHMFRPTGSEIYDLAWSPDANYFIIGSMDNVARIYNVATNSVIRQIAEHSHYVQGVTWDPLNEYIATQSSDRSVHIYSLKSKDGQYTLTRDDEKPPKIASHAKMDLPPRRISSNSPAPITKHITIDTSSAEDPMPALPEPISKPSPAVMDPPPPPTSAAPDAEKSATPSKSSTTLDTNALTPGPKPTFALPYRMVYAVATQDSVLLYDTQQTTPLCINVKTNKFQVERWFHPTHLFIRWFLLNIVVYTWRVRPGLYWRTYVRQKLIFYGCWDYFKSRYPSAHADSTICASFSLPESPASKLGKLVCCPISAGHRVIR